MLGHEVGYCIRFDDCTDPQATRIKVTHEECVVPLRGLAETLQVLCTINESNVMPSEEMR